MSRSRAELVGRARREKGEMVFGNDVRSTRVHTRKAIYSEGRALPGCVHEDEGRRSKAGIHEDMYEANMRRA